MHSRLLWTLILLLTSGCMRPGPWKYVAEDAPWVGPGQQARTKYRKVDAPFLIAAPGVSEYRWEDAHGRGDDQRAFIARAAQFLVDRGGTDSWEAREEL